MGRVGQWASLRAVPDSKAVGRVDQLPKVSNLDFEIHVFQNTGWKSDKRKVLLS
jgi:hypothetical protein